FLPRHRVDEGGNRLASRQALRAGFTARLGVCRRSAKRGSDASGRVGAHPASKREVNPMPMIRETVVSTINAAGQVHFAPIGLIAEDAGWIIAPFRPSVTLDNLREVPFAVANFTDDVRVFAGCLTGRASRWPTAQCRGIRVPRLADALAHAELAVTHTAEDDQRPRFHCRVLCNVGHAPFQGFNRAKAAVIEASILVSRLHMLP